MKIVIIHGQSHKGSTYHIAHIKEFFEVMRLIQKNGFNPRDIEYCKAKGWTGKKRPWK